MLGEKLLIGPEDRRVAAALAERLLPAIRRAEGRFLLGIAGESGSGKSVLAAALAEELEGGGIRALILAQDDYFRLPPKSNEEKRRGDLSWVGPGEVRLDLLGQHLRRALAGAEELEKPLVIFPENRIEEEMVSLHGVKVIIVEGTYVSLLEPLHHRVFIDRTWQATHEARRERGREPQDDFLERVLAIEHGIISAHKALADTLITPDNRVVAAG